MATRRLLAAAIAFLAIGFAAATAAATEFPRTHLRILGGLAGVRLYTDFEEPFWTKRLPALSGGAVTAEIAPFDESGLKAREMLQLMRLGVTPFGTLILNAVAGEDPEAVAFDLAGMNPTIVELRAAAQAYRPVLTRIYRERYGLELLAMYTYPAQVLFCAKPLKSLADLRGKLVRTSAVTQSDFVEALGGKSVIIPFAEITDAIRNGVADCAITGTLSGNGIGLHRVTTHLYNMALTWGVSIFAANGDAWRRIPPSVRELITSELAKLETQVWAAAEEDTQMGFDCDVGRPSCTRGERGQMTLLSPSPKDDELRRRIFEETVLTRWIARCGQACADVWQETVGRALALAPR